MIDWVTAISEATETEVRDILVLILARYRQLYPYGEMQTFWLDYGRSVYDQIDNHISCLESMKKRIGPVLLAPSDRTVDDLTVPPRK
ncbi:MAG: hypothetical protein J6A74_02100 [Oscillospiraceae bacterium]|nr:hypothetical protein [Oscillospiraceae bacterium]